MSLCKLPDTGYTYCSVSSDNWCETIWSAGTNGKDHAQFWIDSDLSEDLYVPAKWWKFWKPTITFKVFACGGTTEPFYKTVKLQEK